MNKIDKVNLVATDTTELGGVALCSNSSFFPPGNLEKFVCYNVSVYPIYSQRIGKPASVEAFLEQGGKIKYSLYAVL